jgi:SAM-dependent methyltransferase
MFAEPDASLGEWRNRLHFSLQQLSHEAQRIKSELLSADRTALTRRRMELQMTATEEHLQTLRRILAPVDVQALQAAYESHLALRTRLPSDQGLTTYYNNIHRDWAWGERENEASLAQLQSALGVDTASDAALADTLVLGAGACRLAYDIHQRFATARTVAIDFNPLLLLVAQIVMGGGELELHEFPIAPRSLDTVAVLQKLSAPGAVREDFYTVLGDVLRPPFAAGSFDTVVTPWLIDIVNEDFPVLAARVNRLLKPGGRWLNFGSLSFEQQTERARRYSPEEIVAMIESSGFGAPEVREASIPYMCSPASRHGRQEIVFTFCAAKRDDARKPARHVALPDWIVTGTEPVPLLPSFQTQALSTQIYSFIMSLIDGRRTIADMALLLEQKKLMSRLEAEPAIRNFLTRMYDDSQRQAGF